MLCSPSLETYVQAVHESGWPSCATKSAPPKSAPPKSAPRKSAPPKYAPRKSAPLKFAPLKFASRKSAPRKSVLDFTAASTQIFRDLLSDENNTARVMRCIIRSEE